MRSWLGAGAGKLGSSCSAGQEIPVETGETKEPTGALSNSRVAPKSLQAELTQIAKQTAIQ